MPSNEYPVLSISYLILGGSLGAEMELNRSGKVNFKLSEATGNTARSFSFFENS